MTLTGTDLATFVAFQMPLGVAMAAAGLVLFRGSHPELHASAPPARVGSWRALRRETSTIWVILLAWGLATLGLALATRAGWLVAPPDWLQRFGPLAVAMLVGLVDHHPPQPPGGRAMPSGRCCAPRSSPWPAS